MATARLSYETAETLVYDPVPANRTATRTVLFTLGFRNIETVATVEDFREAIRNRPPDLALCEAQGADACRGDAPPARGGLVRGRPSRIRSPASRRVRSSPRG